MVRLADVLNTIHSRYAGCNILSNFRSLPCLVASQTLTLQLSLLLVHVLVVLSPLMYVEIDRASKCYESALFQDATTFSGIALTLEPSPKIFGLLTTVGAWPGAVICSLY